jgi:cardiolipin synthase
VVTDSENTSETGVFANVWTWPNLISLLRLLALPVFCWLVLSQHAQIAGAILLGALGATDWVDGYIARRFHQVSTLGKILDPSVDRVLVGVSVIVIMIHGAVPIWFGVLTLAREVIVSVTVVVLAALGAERIDVLWIGKVGAFALMFAYPAFLLGHGPATWQLGMRVFAWVAGGIGLGVGWWAAASYVTPARAALARGREARSARMSGSAQ